MTEATDISARPPSSPIAAALTTERGQLVQQIGSGVRLTTEQKSILRVTATDDIIEIKPTGEIYVPAVYWRRVLNAVFDPFGWGMRFGAVYFDLHEDGKSILYRNVFLMVARCPRCQRSMSACLCGVQAEPYCASEAIGAQEYHPNNKRMSLDDATEAANSNGIMRCCKVFSIYDNVWEPVFAQTALHRLGVKVVATDWRNQEKQLWRLLRARPLAGEIGPAADSPNRDAYMELFRKPKEKPVEHAPAPAAAAQPQRIAEHHQGGEKILVIRKVTHSDGHYWVVNSDPGGECVTNDDELVKALEHAKSHGQRIDLVCETLTTAKGTRRKLVEFSVHKP